MVELQKIQKAMGTEGSIAPDLDFVKYVTMIVKMVEAQVPGGRPLYMFIFTENNYHIKDFLERVYEIEGLDEFFAVPCKFFTRKVCALCSQI